MRTMLQNAERTGVMVILPDHITQRLDVPIPTITSNWDLITVLSDLRERGIQVVICESESLLTMVYSVAQPLGIKLYKLADGEFSAPEAIPQAVKMRLNLLDMVEIKQVEEAASYFSRLGSKEETDSTDQTLANAVNALVGIDEEGDEDDE